MVKEPIQILAGVTLQRGLKLWGGGGAIGTALAIESQTMLKQTISQDLPEHMQHPGPFFIDRSAEQIHLRRIINRVFDRAVLGSQDARLESCQVVFKGGRPVLILLPERLSIAGETFVEPDVGEVVAGHPVSPPLMSQFMSYDVFVASIPGHGKTPGGAGLMFHGSAQFSLNHGIFIWHKWIFPPQVGEKLNHLGGFLKIYHGFTVILRVDPILYRQGVFFELQNGVNLSKI